MRRAHRRRGVKSIMEDEQEKPWDGLIRLAVDDFEIRAVNEDERSVEVVASSEDLDSHGHVVRQFWNLKRYKKNPVVLWNHNLFESSPWSFGGAVRPHDVFPVGRSANVRVEDKKLIAKLFFGSKEYSEIAEKIYLGFKEKILHAVSVGFRPGSVKRVQKGDRVFYELGDEENPNELFEISVVPMGSNPAAVEKAHARVHEQILRLAAGDLSPREGKEPFIMDEKKMKELEAELRLAKSETETARNEAKAATEKATRLEGELEASQKSLTEAQGQRDAEKARVEELSAKLAATEKERDETKVSLEHLQKKAEETEAKLIESEVDSLVGKKINPSEKEEFLELRRTNPDLFNKMIAKRADRPLTERVTDSPKPGEVTKKGSGRLVARITGETN